MLGGHHHDDRPPSCGRHGQGRAGTQGGLDQKGGIYVRIRRLDLPIGKSRKGLVVKERLKEVMQGTIHGNVVFGLPLPGIR